MDEDGLDDDERERLQDIVNELNKDVQQPPYDTDSRKGYSREYKKYKEEESRESETTTFESICKRSASLLNISGGEKTQEKLSPAIRLLDWDVTPGMVLSASVLLGFASFVAWFFLTAVNILLGSPIPVTLNLLFLAVPITVAVYTYYKPVYDAQNKVIRSSGEMILAILYMVVYIRSSPNLEGAIRFAALNLRGPISKDLKGVLWKVEVGEYSEVEEALNDYTRRWKGYNDDFLESLQLIEAALNEPNNDRQDDLLQDAIDRILDGTREKMKHYAQSLKTPVMILNAMGAMLPVLGMIILPLVSVFMGGLVKPLHLIVLFNVMIPGFLYWFMQRILSSRPPTVSSQPASEETLPKRGYRTYDILGEERSVPVWPIGVLVFLVVGFFGIVGYIIFPYMYPVQNVNPGTFPEIFRAGDSAAPLPMLMRSLSLTLGLGWGIGITKYLGNVERKAAEENLRDIEKQFPTALFQLGNKISGGTPIEVALDEAARATSDLEISDLFQEASRNIRDMGMTFEQAVFDESYGALRDFPSQMIHTVMRVVLESSDKGTKMAAMAMTTISRYLDNIHKTQEDLNDLMEETTTTIQLLAYMLAPIISGVAVGMSQTIITAMYQLSKTFQEAQSSLPSAGPESGGAATSGFGGVLSGVEGAIPPEILQFVVGIYLIQLLYILGTFYMKITEGENQTYKQLFTGKILISGMLFYTLTLVIVSMLFGNIISGISVGA
ncbi:MAG: hypothetical protein ABEJ91_02355 [Candidatus Nanohaloarchaea archaeon]